MLFKTINIGSIILLSSGTKINKENSSIVRFFGIKKLNRIFEQKFIPVLTNIRTLFHLIFIYLFAKQIYFMSRARRRR